MELKSITTQKQYEVALEQRGKFDKAIKELDAHALVGLGIDPKLVDAYSIQLQIFYGELQEKIKDYEDAR